MQTRNASKKMTFYRSRMPLLLVVLMGGALLFFLIPGTIGAVNLVRRMIAQGGFWAWYDAVGLPLFNLGFYSTYIAVTYTLLLFWLREMILQWLDNVTLHWQRGVITFRSAEIGRIDRITHVQLRKLHHPKDPKYIASVILKNHHQIWLEVGDNRQRMLALANEVADKANVMMKFVE